MKVILVNGSPHKSGCTYTALKEIADELEKNGIEVELFWTGNKPLSGCMGCRSCYDSGKCIMDDMVNEFALKASSADGFVFGSPVHYAAPSGFITSFMDRLFYSGGRFLANKPAAAIVSCRRGGASSAFDQLNKYFTLLQMPVIASQYWNMVHGTCPGEVRQDAEGLQTMRTLARNMAYFLKCREAGIRAGVPLPERESQIFTNFIR